MAIFSNIQFNSIDDLLLRELNDLYDAERRMCDALPQMADAASNPALKQAFTEHLSQTKCQVSRLEQIFVDLGKPAGQETCYAMKGLIKEGSEIVDAVGNPDVKDAALISAAQRIEHYEIAGYGSARAFAQHRGHSNVVRLLQSTLDEEKETDAKLTKLAEEGINVRAEQTASAAAPSGRAEPCRAATNRSTPTSRNGRPATSRKVTRTGASRKMRPAPGLGNRQQDDWGRKEKWFRPGQGNEQGPGEKGRPHWRRTRRGPHQGGTFRLGEKGCKNP